MNCCNLANTILQYYNSWSTRWYTLSLYMQGELVLLVQQVRRLLDRNARRF